jgi:RNA polymerase sigma-70 factor (ECF subfamily)
MEDGCTTIEKIWFELHEDVHRFICSRVNHNDNCHDIVQDVFLKLASNSDAFERVENIKAYIVRIASNTITDSYRKAKALQAPSDAIIGLPDEVQDRTEYLSDQFLHKTISALPEPYREAIIKTELEGLTQKAYADYAGVSLSGAKSRVQRAKIKLKEQILACCDYGFDKYGNVISCCGHEITGSCCR